MDTVSFAITAENFEWIDGGQDNPEDLCAHGDVTVLIGDEALQYSCCASASALRMLRTLSEDHAVEDSMLGQQMLPCCGFNMYADASLENVFISGCSGGIDYAVHHKEDAVVIATEAGNQYTVSFEEYRREVMKFAHQVEAVYNQCSPKILPDHDPDRSGYIAFWNEWKRRMAEEEMRMRAVY